MAAVTSVSPTVFSASAGTSFVSNAFTPAAGDLLVVFVYARDTAANGALTGSTGLTFTRIAQRSDFGNGAYLFVANALASNVSQTVRFTCTGDLAIGCYIKIARISGMTKTAAAAFRQYATADGDSGDPLAATFAAAALTGNPILAFAGVDDQPTGLSEPAGFATIEETSVMAFTLSAAFSYVDSGFTDTSVEFGDEPESDAVMYVVELDASTTAGGRSFAACAA
jgi:hypothetical protein